MTALEVELLDAPAVGPVVGVLAGAEPPPLLRTFIEALAAQVRIAGPPVEADAYLTYRYPPGVTGAPTAEWVEESPGDTAATVLLTDSAQLAHRLGRRAVLVADTGMHDARPVSAWVRSRIRAARDLAPDLVVRLDATGCVRYAAVEGERAPLVPVPTEAVPSAVAVAAAVIALTPEALHLSLAWGAPTVTDAVTAAAVGAYAGEQVRVATSRAEQLRAAHSLATDLETAAGLGWRGRLWQEQRDLRYSVRTVLRRLLAGVPTTPEQRVTDALDELGTPAGAAIRDRAALFVDCPI